MLSLALGRYFGLNSTAMAIWDRLASPIAVSHLCDALVGEYDVDRDRAAPAVLAFLSRLIEEEIVAVQP